MANQCPTCKHRRDYVGEHYWECGIPRPSFVSMYNTRGPLLINKGNFDPERPQYESLKDQDCPAWKKGERQ